VKRCAGKKEKEKTKKKRGEGSMGLAPCLANTGQGNWRRQRGKSGGGG